MINDTSKFEGHTPEPLTVMHFPQYTNNIPQYWCVYRETGLDVVGVFYNEPNAYLFAAAPTLLRERDEARAEVERLKAETAELYRRLDAEKMLRAEEYQRAERERLAVQTVRAELVRQAEETGKREADTERLVSQVETLCAELSDRLAKLQRIRELAFHAEGELDGFVISKGVDVALREILTLTQTEVPK